MNSKLALILILCATFFELGCTVAQRKEILDEAKAYAIANAKEVGKSVLAGALEASKSYVDKKLAEKEAEELKELDAHLAVHKTVTEDGTEVVKTWRDFDADKSGSLEDTELAKIAQFITALTARKVASGEMGKDEAGRHAKSAGITLAALMAILLGKRAVTSMAKKSGAPPPTGGAS